MRQIGRKIAAAVLVLCLLLSQMACGGGSDLDSQISSSAKSLQKFYESKEKQPLSDETVLPAGSSGSDWTAIVLKLSGREDAYEEYLERLEAYVAREYAANGCLSPVKATESQRISLTILALGGDPTAIETDQGTIDLVADGTWNFIGGSPGLQGSNGLIYALLTLDGAAYEGAGDAANIRQEVIDELLTYQQESGGFCLDNSMGGDVDITAMAIQSLAPYIGDTQVGTAVDRALTWLSEQMTENACFIYNYGDNKEETVESSAQVILALCALGIDPEEDERFQAGETNLLEGLNRFRMKDGMYMHTLEDGEANAMATYQSLLALEAVQKLRADGGWILNFAREQKES